MNDPGLLSRQGRKFALRAPLAATKRDKKYIPAYRPRNPLKSLDSNERIQGNPTQFNAS
jgi:hypothetical protein